MKIELNDKAEIIDEKRRGRVIFDESVYPFWINRTIDCIDFNDIVEEYTVNWFNKKVPKEVRKQENGIIESLKTMLKFE